MSLTTTSNRYQYAGNGIATAFAFPEPFLVNGDLKVVFTVAYVDTVQTTGFTVTGATLADGGTVTFAVAPPTGTTVTIYRDPAQTQPIQYVTQDDFPSATHEKALDRLTMLVQMLSLKVKRTFRLPVTEAELTELTISARKGKLITFNSVTGALEYIDRLSIDQAVLDAQSAAEQALASATAAAASAALAAAYAGTALTSLTGSPTSLENVDITEINFVVEATTGTLAGGDISVSRWILKEGVKVTDGVSYVQSLVNPTLVWVRIG